MERTLITVPTAIPMVALVGPADKNLREIESAFPNVSLTVRGNEIALRGDVEECDRVEQLITELLVVLRSGQDINPEVIKRSIGMLKSHPQKHPAEVLSLNIVSNRGRTIRPKTANQKAYVEAIAENTITFGIGPAGTGKTYLAMAKAVAALQAREINRIILTRPAVEAGEHLGFLPGTLTEKIDPYLRPLFDALHDMLDQDAIPKLMQSGVIEVAPLAYMRGRTLNDSFIILDEAQNTTPEQMKMFLTRLGFGSKMVITGDVTQVDLPGGKNSGLATIRKILDGVDDICFMDLTAEDVVRHRLISDIVSAYEKFEVNSENREKEYFADSPFAMIEIENRSGELAPEAEVLALMKNSIKELGLHPDCELTVAFIDDREMEELHIKWMDLPGSTDVMSFPMDELRPNNPEPGILGDIVISPRFARAQAEKAGHSFEHEVKILAAHGLLHLLGYDHQELDEEKVMFALQEDLVRKVGK